MNQSDLTRESKDELHCEPIREELIGDYRIALKHMRIRIKEDERTLMGPWICGYIGLPEDHPLTGVSWDPVDECVQLPGGCTYIDYVHPWDPDRNGERYWIGYDRNHAGDLEDPTAQDIEANYQILVEAVQTLQRRSIV